MTFERTDLIYLQAHLRSAGIRPNKGLGQHFLLNASVLDRMLEAAEVSAADTVLEIGPGPGVLTERLIAAAGRVVALELDSDFAQLMRVDFPDVEIIEGDVLQTLPATVAELGDYKVVANIPYQITTPLFRLLFESGLSRLPSSVTLLIQREVAERLSAKASGQGRGYLSVLAQYFTDVQYVTTVSPDSFWPVPKVDSAVIHLTPRTDRPVAIEEERAFLAFVRRHFINPRKQLRNVIAGLHHLDSTAVDALFAKLGWPSNKRAQEITLEEWVAFYGALK